MGEEAFKNLSVLVIDPNRHLRGLVRGVLHAFGIRSIHDASDAAEAFQDLKTFMPHVVIVELNMEPLDGLEFTRLVRRGEDSPNPYVPVLMLTAHTERRYVEAARDAGVNEFLAKPISAETLYARLYSAVFRQRSFVTTKAYVGPDRRRRQNVKYSGPERRRKPTMENG